MIQYSCVNKYIDVIVADSSLPCWRSNIEFDCILADRNIKYILLTVKLEKLKLCIFYSSIWY